MGLVRKLSYPRLKTSQDEQRVGSLKTETTIPHPPPPPPHPLPIVPPSLQWCRSHQASDSPDNSLPVLIYMAVG